MVLDHIKADSARIARLALAAMSKTWPVDTHARVLLGRLSDIDIAQIPFALAAIIELASPNDDFPFGLERSRPPQPELLRALWATHPASVSQGLDGLLSSRRYNDVELAARGMLALHESD